MPQVCDFPNGILNWIGTRLAFIDDHLEYASRRVELGCPSMQVFFVVPAPKVEFLFGVNSANDRAEIAVRLRAKAHFLTHLVHIAIDLSLTACSLRKLRKKGGKRITSFVGARLL